MSFDFTVGQKVVIKNDRIKIKVEGIIMGKLKDMDAYIVATSIPNETNNLLIVSYGLPIRNVELEFGKFSGRQTEFIINSKDLTKRDQ